MNEPAIDSPLLTLDFLLAVLPKETGERLAQRAQIRAATEPSDLLKLVASLLDSGIQKQEKDIEQNHQDAFLRELEKRLI